MKIRYFSRQEIMQDPALAKYCLNGEHLNWAIAETFPELNYFSRAVVADEGREQVYVHPGNNGVILHVLRDSEPPRMLATFGTVEERLLRVYERDTDFIETTDQRLLEIIMRPSVST